MWPYAAQFIFPYFIDYSNVQLPIYSEVQKIQELPEFSQSAGDGNDSSLPQDLRITHVSE